MFIIGAAIAGLITLSPVAVDHAAPVPPPEPVQVVMVGDSITARTVNQPGEWHRARLEACLPEGSTVDVVAFPGWTTATATAVLAGYLATHDPDIVSVELGENDTPFVSTPEQADATYAALLELVGDRTVVMTTVHDTRPEVQPAVRLLNAAIHRTGNAVAEWRRVVIDHDGWLMDHTHPNDTGAVQLSELWCEAVTGAASPVATAERLAGIDQ